MDNKRAIVIVLDSAGVGELPDAASFGDVGVNTFKSCSQSEYFNVPNMADLGLFNIDGIGCGTPVATPKGVYGKCAESSMGKDTTIGHWEIAGLITPAPLPTFPNGFPDEVLEPFKEATGREVLCNEPASGTEVIKEYGDEHIHTGDLIVYTSADSVFQIAAHEDVVPLEDLYEYCRIARRILKGKYGVGRVIARPFIGKNGNFTRTSNRHDFSLEPPKPTMLDLIKRSGRKVIGVGKIHDIFAGRGITDFVYTSGNEEGIEKTIDYMNTEFNGLLFTNLVDFDMLYGHRRDIDGYAKALSYFDSQLPRIMEALREDDLLLITADHGCDPAYKASTDHTREYVPLLLYKKGITPENLHTRRTYADMAQTVCAHLGVSASSLEGESVL
ncbi:MAG: phosphopentomutase [Lachnospiraceae bacterium]|nr:phosphopentomutase [Lachnospiraceae bacterium]